MDDVSLSSRRSHSSRAESTSSSNTKMTLPTSNGSSSNPRSLSSTLLQERLRERKTESSRQSRSLSVDVESVGDRTAHNSPARTSASNREDRSNSLSISKALGVKQVEEQLSTLHKQNFDLKLELYHRRKRQEALEAKLDVLEKQLAEQNEIQDLNDRLLAELEKRDQAVEEAVEIIVNLENKVEDLQEEVNSLKRDREHVRAIDAEYSQGFFQADHAPPSSPPQVPKKMESKTRMPRMPSFLTENSEGAEALRSLYLPRDRAYSDCTLPQLPEEETASEMSSPRLSVLSESSFLSVYGGKQLPEQAFPSEDYQRHRASSSVEKWVGDRLAAPHVVAPTGQFRSSRNVMESPLQRLEKLNTNVDKASQSIISQRSAGANLHARQKSKDLQHAFLEKSSFEEQRGLPPTPDTISTSTLRHFQTSDDALRMRNGTFLISSSTIPVPIETHNAYQSAISVRPKSAGTIESRREDWDNETRSGRSDAASIASVDSFVQDYAGRGRFEAPELFSLRSGDWGHDLYTNRSSRITDSRREELRRSSVVEPHGNDDTPVQSKAVTRFDDPQSSPPTPDRRSSLAAPTRLRKTNMSNSSNQPASPSPTKKEDKKYKLSSLLPFKRDRSDKAEPSPTLNTFDPPVRAVNPAKPMNHFSEFDEGGGATPPPIMRSRDQRVKHRPVSVGSESMIQGPAIDLIQQDRVGRSRRGSAAGPVEAVEQEVEKPHGRRGWLGFARTGSIRRN